MFLSVLIVMYGIHQGNVLVQPSNIMNYIYMVIIMTILWYEMEIIIRSLAFFVVSTNHITKVEEAGMELCMKVPGVAFKGAFKFLFYCILPYGIMATFPTLSLTGDGTMNMMLYGTGIVILFGGIARLLWKMGVKHYNSVNS